jgi:hypothetical protein
MSQSIQATSPPSGQSRLHRAAGSRAAARPPWLGVWLSFGVAVLIDRLKRLDGGLLYPDGYQYLLMAKGIARNGRAMLDTGAGGNVLLPNADAALKPLQPLLMAVGHHLGLGWLESARLVTALAGAAVVVLVAVIARRLTGSDMLAAAAAAICLASPTLTWWAGFVGPDMLAPALALAALLAAREGRPRLAGCLAALAAATRPEYLLASIAALIGAALGGQRRAAAQALPAAALTLAVVIGMTRPPISAPSSTELVQGVVGCLIGGVGYALMPQLSEHHQLVRICAATVIALAALATLAGRAEGLRQLVGDQPLIVAVVIIGTVLALSSADRTFALRLLVLVGLVAGIYWQKNPNLDRYLIQLLPFLVIIAACGLRRMKPQQLMLAMIAAAVLLTIVAHPAAAPRTTDSFRTIGAQLTATGQPLISASPDAYSFWLPDRPQQQLQIGSHGLILLDATARAYLPHLHVCGQTLAVFDSGPGFSASGGIDDRPARLIQGTARSGRCPGAGS